MFIILIIINVLLVIYIFLLIFFLIIIYILLILNILHFFLLIYLTLQYNDQLNQFFYIHYMNPLILNFLINIHNKMFHLMLMLFYI